jgi:hypothetical protein
VEIACAGDICNGGEITAIEIAKVIGHRLGERAAVLRGTGRRIERHKAASALAARGSQR